MCQPRRQTSIVPVRTCSHSSCTQSCPCRLSRDYSRKLLLLLCFALDLGIFELELRTWLMLSFPAMPAKCQLRLRYLKLNAQELCRDESMRSCQIVRLETHVVHSLRKVSPLAFDVGEHHSDNEFFRDECDTNRAQTLNGVSALKRTDLEL